ncbi:hypothetical protein AB1E33_20240 [Ruegeria sp. 2012CJ15-1]
MGSPDGEASTPLDTYVAADGYVEGVAIFWNGDAKAGRSAFS